MNKPKTRNVNQLLKKAGVKQIDIARRLGVSAQFVNAVASGKRSTFRVKTAIAEALNKPITDLWPAAEQENPVP